MSRQKNNKRIQIRTVTSNWEMQKLGNIAEVESGFGFPVKYQGNRTGQYPFIKVGDMNLSTKYLDRAENYVDEKIIEKLKAKVFPPGTVIFPKIGMAIHLNKYRILTVPATFDNNVAGIIPKKLMSEFLYYYFFSMIDLKRLACQTTVPSIRKSTLEKLLIPVPSKREQRKIAEILSTVDEAIEKIDQAIEKTERLKKGLMQELLTKGIGLKEFKDTEIGTIPKEWEVVQLEQVIKNIRNGFASGKRDDNGVVQIRMNNVTTDGKVIFDSYLKVPKPDNINEWLLDNGDFLFNNTNSYDLVGKSAVFKESPFLCTYSNHFTRIKFNTSRANSDFILYHFLTLWRKGYFKSVAIRHVGQSAVHSRYLLKLSIPLPSIVEQRKVVEIISGAEQRLKTLVMKKQKFEKIKKGLMNDLLAGKRRIKV